MRIAVVGVGYWGRNLVRNFSSLGVLHSACEIDADLREAIARDNVGLNLVIEPNAIFANQDVDAVVIATPAATHGKLVAAALDAGKHVFVEKPLCLDLQEARALKAKADKAGLTLMVGHMLLYHTAFKALREVIEKGALGDLRYIYSTRLSLGKIRREENALWSFAPHDISMILSIAGQVPIEVVAKGEAYLRDGVADTTLSHFTFSNGLQAHIFVSWLHPFKDHRLVVVGSDGMIVFDDVRQGPDKLLLYRHQVEWRGDIPNVGRAEGEPLPYADEEPIRAECKHFIECVGSGRQPESDASEGIRVLSVLDACQKSLTSGESVRLNARG